MGRECGTHGGEEMHTYFWSGNLKEGDHLKVLSINLSRDAHIFEKCRSYLKILGARQET
jgi:hypothetical protein